MVFLMKETLVPIIVIAAWLIGLLIGIDVGSFPSQEFPNDKAFRDSVQTWMDSTDNKIRQIDERLDALETKVDPWQEIDPWQESFKKR